MDGDENSASVVERPEARIDLASPEILEARARFPRDVLLARIARDIRSLFPNRVERLVLYGSRARGDARDQGSVDDSDWDLGIFLEDGPTTPDRYRAYDWAQGMLLETWRSISPHLFSAEAHARRTIFMKGLRQDAIDL